VAPTIEGHPGQLFELGTDPNEQKDVLRARPEVEARLRRHLEAHRTAADAHRRGRVEKVVPLTQDTTERLRTLGYIE
jgi:hypothetical protein